MGCMRSDQRKTTGMENEIGMNTSVADKNARPVFRAAYLPAEALAVSVDFSQDMMHVALTDGRIISVPLAWFPLLREAAAPALKKVEICGGGISLHWPALDEDICVAGLLAGGDAASW